MWSAPGLRPCSVTGTDIISCRAPPSRLGFGMLLLIPLIVIALARIEEIAAVAFGRKPLRLIASPPLAPDAAAPKVSIHIPAHNEPPEMLKQTLDAVARLDYHELRMRRRHQQHARSGAVAADRGALPHARRALQVRARRQHRRLQGGRAASRPRPHRGRRRSDRHHRCRLCRAAGLAEGSRPAVPTIRPSAWCRRRRITAMANAASCTTP